MKVQNMTGRSGNSIANQFIIIDDDTDCEYFQSYESIIVKKCYGTISDGGGIYLDSRYWDYSAATGKYRNQFLGESKKETQAKIDSGEYILTDLNG